MDFMIFKLFDLCPITIPNIPVIIINKNSKNIVAISVIIKLNTEQSKYMADCSNAIFNDSHVSLFKQHIARLNAITTNDVNSVIIAVKIFDVYISLLLTGSVCVKYDSSLYMFFINLAQFLIKQFIIILITIAIIIPEHILSIITIINVFSKLSTILVIIAKKTVSI